MQQKLINEKRGKRKAPLSADSEGTGDYSLSFEDTIRQVKNHPEMIEFIGELEKLHEMKENGALAYLKKGLRKTIGEEPRAARVFYEILPGSVIRSRDEEIYFIVAALFPFNPGKSEEHPGNFGTTMNKIKNLPNQGESIKERFISLLNSNFETIENDIPADGSLTYRLSQLVRLAASKGIGINWLQLLYDLTHWSAETRFVQKRWAQEFFR